MHTEVEIVQVILRRVCRQPSQLNAVHIQAHRSKVHGKGCELQRQEVGEKGIISSI